MGSRVGWMKLALALWGGIMPLVAQAGNEAGNGGDVVICYEGKEIVSAKLLDFHEAEVMRPELVAKLGPSNLTPIEKVVRAFQRLSVLDEKRTKEYNAAAAKFFTNTRFVKGVVLEDIPDSGYVPIGKSCKVEQIAIQKQPVFPEDRLYTISRELWDLLDNDHRAGLMIHEIVYGEAIRLGHKNSIKARYFTELIASEKLETMEPEEYARLIALIMGDSPLPGTVKFAANDFSFEAIADQPFSLALLSLLVSPGTGGLVWNAMGLPSWLVLDSPNGVLMGTPSRVDVGAHRFRLAVKAGDSGAITNVTIVVRRQNLPPFWAQDPIPLTTREKQLFSVDLAKYVRDPDGDPLTFRIISGPSWVTIAATGVLTGTPAHENVGENRFVVDVSDGLTSQQVTIVISVIACSP